MITLSITCIGRADLDATAVSYTFIFIEGDMGFHFYGFGIAAPDTVQGAPLEEHDSSDARSIVETVALNIEYPPPYLLKSICLLRIFHFFHRAD